MKSLEALFISFCLIASCACNPEIYNPGTGYNPPTTPDKPSVPEEPEEPETPEEPGTDPAEKDGTLYADGNDAKTYELILACGYNHEAPDNWHPEGNVRHIGQSYDKELDKYVFDFHLHILTDGDKDKPLKDRQRNEIKTDAGSPASMVAQNGETLRMTWKFRLPEGMKTTKSFLISTSSKASTTRRVRLMSPLR